MLLFPRGTDNPNGRCDAEQKVNLAFILENLQLFFLCHFLTLFLALSTSNMGVFRFGDIYFSCLNTWKTTVLGFLSVHDGAELVSALESKVIWLGSAGFL